MNEIENIAAGCSHSWGWRIEEKEIWTNIVEKRTGVHFYKRVRPGVGLTYLVCYIKQLISKNLFEVKNIKRVVLQKPQSIRFPWRGCDGSGYRYTNGLGGSRHPRLGHEESVKEYVKLSQENQQVVANNILSGEKRRLDEFYSLFPNAKFLYFQYWGDHLLDLIHRPILAPVNMELEKHAEAIGMENAGMIVDLDEIEGITNDDGDYFYDGKILVKNGWWVGPENWHPAKYGQEIFASRIERWINENPV